MLLYDTLIRHATKHQILPNDPQLLSILLQAEVFELSNVTPLLPDWETGRHQPISKQPPFPNLWAEWRYRDANKDTGTFDEFEQGAHLLRLTGAQLHELLRVGTVDDTLRTEYLTQMDEVYTARLFSRMVATNLHHEGLHRLTVVAGVTFFGFQAQGTIVHTMRFGPDYGTWVTWMNAEDERHPTDGADGHPDTAAQLMADAIRPWACFGLTVDCAIPLTDRFWQASVPWPPLMAFALLHCRNVETVRQEAPRQLNRQVQRRGHPPLASYHVLQLHVQESLRRLVGETATPPAPDRRKPRFHLVRGHFKNLQHERYHEKGWHWWPAHWRGDIESGAVMKDYAIVR